MLDGQGGDEILAGYRAYFGYRLSDLVRQGRLREAGAELTAFGAVNGPRWAAVALVNPHVPERAPPGGAVAPARLLDARPPRAARARRTRPERHGLPGPAAAPARARPDPSWAARAAPRRGPQLDGPLAGGAGAVPRPSPGRADVLLLDGGELIHRGETKSAPRRALDNLLPAQVRERREELGFVTPEGRFLRGSLGTLAADVFASRAFEARGFVDAAAPAAARAAPARRARRRVRALACTQPRALGTALPRRMKVLFMTTAYPTPESPVAGVFVKEHARAAALHAEVAVVHLDRSGGPPPRRNASPARSSRPGASATRRTQRP